MRDINGMSQATKAEIGYGSILQCDGRALGSRSQRSSYPRALLNPGVH